MSEIELPGGDSPFVNSDILIKTFIKKDKETKKRFDEARLKLHVDEGERFIINDFVINDVLTAAQEAQIPMIEILNQLYLPTGFFFRFIAGRAFIERVFALEDFLRQNCLTITDWITLWVMHGYNKKILISDKTEIDDVLKHKNYKQYFGNIRRI